MRGINVPSLNGGRCLIFANEFGPTTGLIQLTMQREICSLGIAVLVFEAFTSVSGVL